MLDYVLMSRRDLTDFKIIRFMRGADYGTDLLMQRAISRLKVKPPVKRCFKTTRKLDVTTLTDQKKKEFKNSILDLLITYSNEDGCGRSAPTFESWAASQRGYKPAALKSPGCERRLTKTSLTKTATWYRKFSSTKQTSQYLSSSQTTWLWGLSGQTPSVRSVRWRTEGAWKVKGDSRPRRQ